ncbi:MAG: hypothetical protein H5U40_07335, partial [Polyangiaceae bacterium]|nr:hypothetical protein [Polyangiaceae bacterium]
VTEDCPEVELEGDSGIMQLECLTTFRGGYCGLQNCASSLECPDGSMCVAHTDGQSYCFRTCNDKSECNRNRSVANEANCASNITLEDPSEAKLKACVPPSSGI